MTFWTIEKKQTLRKLVAEGHTNNDLAKYFDKTPNAIIGVCYSLKLKPRLEKEKNLKSRGGKPTTVNDHKIVRLITKHTDKYGWGLEFEEVVEYSQIEPKDVIHSLRRLIKSGRLNKIESAVAGHVFYNDARVRQKNIPPQSIKASAA